MSYLRFDFVRRVSTLLVVVVLHFSSGTIAMTFGQSEPCVAIPTTEEALRQLPVLRDALQTELPVWARAMASNNPYTTAAMLELDYKMRSVPAASLRWRSLARLAVSTVNKSDYGKAYAEFDLQRSDGNHLLAAASSDTLPELEDTICKFATQMALAACDVTDEQVTKLIDSIGEEELVGLVLHIGYASFQDRLIHALQLPLEKEEPLAPIAVDFVDSTPNGANTPAAERPDQSNQVTSDSPLQRNIDWQQLAFTEIQSKLSKQREREPRIRIPDWEEIESKLPADLYTRPIRIRWSRLVVGYQPVIGPAWIKCLRVFEQEAHQDRVFEESIFWIVTRSLKCFYCMGHCEMLMEVGGLQKGEIANRTKRLASGDWSSFTSQEQAAFAFAHKLTHEPSTVTCEDYQELVAALGEARAMDCVWWICRSHFMTKVSDGFQLQLEVDNVFQN